MTKILCDLTATTDSYSNNYKLVEVKDIIEFVQNQRKDNEYRFNLYNGGKVDSRMATIKCHRPRFHLKDCIKLQFASDVDCRNFEKEIKFLFNKDNFSQRIYP